MGKIKELIRTKLAQFLLIDKMQEHLLEEIVRLDKNNNTSNREINQIRSEIIRTNNLLKDDREDIDILHDTIRSVVSVGADIVPNSICGDRSWAVVCIEGRCNVVKFIDLYGADYNRILNFLKQYEGSRMVIDALNSKYFENMFKL